MSGQNSIRRSAIKISFVIPVYNLQNYIEECLDSITRQGLEDIEIITVDGGSTDESVQILDDLSKGEPRLKVLRADRIGPGLARNLGVAAASGEYVWFVDGDDAIQGACLPVIVDRLNATLPDVLLIGHEAVSRRGRSRQPSYERQLMAAEDPGCFTVDQRPSVLNLTMTCWNKIIRREFFNSVDASFSPDWPHEDVPVSCLLLLQASRIAVLNKICYSYRINRLGSTLSSCRAKDHFRIFQSYHAILDRVTATAGTVGAIVSGEVRRSLFERAIWHYSSIFDGRFGRLARGHERRSFFDRMHQDFVHYVPPGYRRPRGLRGIKLRLIERNSYVAYSLLQRAVRLQSAARSLARATGERWSRGGPEAGALAAEK